MVFRGNGVDTVRRLLANTCTRLISTAFLAAGAHPSVLSDSLGVALLHAVTGGRSRREMLKMCMMMLLFVLEHSDQLWQVVQSRTYNTLFLLDLIWR